MKNKDNYFEVVEDGVLKKYYIVKLCNYKNNNYVIYKDNDNEEFFASKYGLVDDDIVLDEILNDDEWDYLEKELRSING